MEDHGFAASSARFVKYVSSAEFWQALAGQSQPGLRNIFGPDIKKLGSFGCGTDSGCGIASLGLLRPTALPTLKIRNILGKKQIRMTLTEQGTEYDLSVTDIRYYQKDHSTPSGFDYEKEIKVLSGNRIKMPAGSSLEVSSRFPPMEGAHETVLFSKDLNALFASDLVYNQVHLWMGAGVNREAAKNWKKELDRLSEKYGPLKSTVYPGHGPATDSSVFAADKKYIDDLLAAVASSKSPEEAKSRMIEEYPAWLNTDFILVQSIKFQTGELQKKPVDGAQ